MIIATRPKAPALSAATASASRSGQAAALAMELPAALTELGTRGGPAALLSEAGPSVELTVALCRSSVHRQASVGGQRVKDRQAAHGRVGTTCHALSGATCCCYAALPAIKVNFRHHLLLRYSSG